jgi:transcriptional regulator with XRE-family HTH domain
MTQDDLAKVTGILANNLSSLENDKMPMTLYYAEIFGAAFGLPPLAFLYPNGGRPRRKELDAIERRMMKFVKIDRKPSTKSKPKKSKAG